MSKNFYYNISSFKFFRRHVKRSEMEKEFIKLIYNKNNISKSNPKSHKYNFPKEKKINLGFYFQKHSLELINKIRDLFIEFDEDKSNTFEQNEFYEMFNMNKIPITMDEIIYLFKFNSHKKSISFSELINLTFNPDFDKRYKEVIEKIKPRCEIGIICPDDFSGMLSHLCEFGKLSSDAKKFRKKMSKSKNNLILNHLKTKSKSKIFFDKEDINQCSDRDENNKLSLRLDDKNISNKSTNNRNNSNHITLSLTDSELANKINQYNKENDFIVNTFKTFLEISNKKLIRNEILFKETNYRNKIEMSQRHLFKSIDTLHKINPKIDNTYISYCPLKEKFMNLNTGRLYDSKNIKEYRIHPKTKNKHMTILPAYKPILTEANKNQDKYYNSFFEKNITKK